MSLHRLLGFRVAVPDPEGLAAYYGELGLSGDHTTGWTGTDGGAAVTVDEGTFRRLDHVTVGCADEQDVAAIVGRLESGGATVTLAADGGSVTVVDQTTRGPLHRAGRRPLRPSSQPSISSSPTALGPTSGATSEPLPCSPGPGRRVASVTW